MGFEGSVRVCANVALHQRRIAHLAACGVMEQTDLADERSEDEDSLGGDGHKAEARGPFPFAALATTALSEISNKCPRVSRLTGMKPRHLGIAATAVVAFCAVLWARRAKPEPVTVEVRPWVASHPMCSMCVDDATEGPFDIVPRGPGETHDLLVFCTGGASEIAPLPGNGLPRVPRSCHVAPIGDLKKLILPIQNAGTIRMNDRGWDFTVPVQYYVDVAWNETSTLAGRLVFVRNKALAVKMFSELRYRQSMAGGV